MSIDDYRRRLDAAAERGKGVVESCRYAPPRGADLGQLTAWVLDVFEGSPQPWKGALYAEQESAGGRTAQ